MPETKNVPYALQGDPKLTHAWKIKWVNEIYPSSVAEAVRLAGNNKEYAGLLPGAFRTRFPVCIKMYLLFVLKMQNKVNNTRFLVATTA